MACRHRFRGVFKILSGVALLTGAGAFAHAQAPSGPPQIAQNVPPLPAPPSPNASVPSAGDADRAALEDRIRQLEGMVQQLSGQVQQLAVQPAVGPADTSAPDVGSPATAVTPSQSGGAGAPGQSLPPNPAPSKRFDSPATLDNFKANTKFGPGFEIRSDDDEYIFQFHNLTQIDYRGYQQGGQNPVHDTFGIPRQWFMFSGRITKPIGYFVSLAHGFDTVSLLDVFLDFSYDPRLQARIGRFKTPFTYEFLVDPIQGLINPERSVFFNNFGQNRDIGAMLYGRLFDKTFDYAAGIFNGTRNGVLDNSDSKFVSGFINWKPFGNAEGSALENFNIGGSVFAGNAASVPIPQTLRTVVPTGGNSIIGVPFLSFNNNVRETGFQAFWSLHAAWYYKQLALIGEWQSGTQDYSLTSTPALRTRLPVDAFYVQMGYLLTGETRSTIGIVRPLRPFKISNGEWGPGAWELATRYQYMDIGNQVFTAGLSDPNNGANRLFLTDFGFNWYLNQYVKVMFDWEHAEFNQPVIFAPGRRQLTSDLFLLRLQLYF
jgi:phosphate-selective porin OprO/OprP